MSSVLNRAHSFSFKRASLIVAVLSSAFFCAIHTVAFRRKDAHGEPRSKGMLWFMLGIMLISGASVAINNKFNLYLSGVYSFLS